MRVDTRIDDINIDTMLDAPHLIDLAIMRIVLALDVLHPIDIGTMRVIDLIVGVVDDARLVKKFGKAFLIQKKFGVAVLSVL